MACNAGNNKFYLIVFHITTPTHGAHVQNCQIDAENGYIQQKTLFLSLVVHPSFPEASSMWTLTNKPYIHRCVI